MKHDVKYIGNYKILDIIGRGGMARVYTAIHVPLDRVVVVKEMGKSESRKRFKQEALISAELDHPNIVSLYDYFSIGQSCYIVMQYVDGINLAEILEQSGALDPATAALVTHEICRAVGYAHQNEIIHRDIKPTNVLIASDGFVKITDFGVARGKTHPRLTSTGAVVGTPYYMSPEQAAGEDLTSRSDIYSIGIVLYEMITGKKPFTGQNANAVTAKVLRGHYASPFFSGPHHSYRLSRIINRAMKKNRNRRYETAEQMAHALSRFIGWKKLAQKEKILKELVQTVDHAKKMTTIVKKPKKKRRRKQKGTPWYLYALLFAVLGALLYYIYNLVFR
ncbi:MAG: serine/threonine protein kinase [candidate division WOR-3 bacterium]|nr:MAG: serine/threonine protein kinase [candidate division WOR-3 bacterium]